MNDHEETAKRKWNLRADQYNQWDCLDAEEKSELIAAAATLAENERLREIIQRASAKFCEHGPDGAIAAAMFRILGESANTTDKPTP
jgi:hypothetical protein